MQNTPHPQPLPLAFDLALSGMLTCFFCTVFSTWGTRSDAGKNKVPLINDCFQLLGLPDTACGWRLYRIFPMGVHNLALRGLSFGATLVLPVLILTVLGVEAHCLRTDLSPCFITGHTYIYFKAGWVAALTTVLFPAILLSALHVPNVPDSLLSELGLLPRAAAGGDQQQYQYSQQQQQQQQQPYATGHYVPVPTYGTA